MLLLILLSTTQTVRTVSLVKGNLCSIYFSICTEYIILDTAVCAISSISELAESYKYSSKRKILESCRLQASLSCNYFGELTYVLTSQQYIVNAAIHPSITSGEQFDAHEFANLLLNYLIEKNAFRVSSYTNCKY